MRELAQQVAALLPGRRVAGTTLAAPGGLERALAEAGGAPVVYPLFMSDGWFVSDALPERLMRAGCSDASIATPLGLDPAVRALCLGMAVDAVAGLALAAEETALLLAAHGSPTDPRPRQAAERAARHIAEGGAFRTVTTGFVDEPPYIANAARLDGPAICLPFFATRAGHVATDLPGALAAAGFAGAVLPPVGTNPHVPAIIAAELGRHLRPA